jgi:hypothetical protein
MLNNIKFIFYFFIAAAFLLTSCDQSSVTSTPDEKVSPGNVLSSSNSDDPRNIDLGSVDSFDDINPMLAEQGLNVRLAYAETVTKANGAETAEGQTIFANDRTKRLGSQWVPGDERRDAEGNDLDYIIWDVFEPANFGTSDQVSSTPAIDASFDTYNNVKKKAKLNIIKQPNTFANPSAILGSGDPFLADISEVGFLPGFLFDAVLGAGSSQNVLGVAFTFVFIDGAGNPTDINNDGFDDIALKEIWYNDNFLWTDQGDAGTGVDIETVALHENGHALGFGHFGKIFITNNNNKLHVSPRAVMNAIILGEQRDLLGTDKASYNSLYGNWPKN